MHRKHNCSCNSPSRPTIIQPPFCDTPYSDEDQYSHLSLCNKKYCEPNTVLATCFRQFAGTSVTWRAISSCQDSYPTKTGCLCYGWLQISIWAVWICAAPWPLVVCPLQFILCTALPTARCLPRAVSVTPTDTRKQRFIHKQNHIKAESIFVYPAASLIKEIFCIYESMPETGFDPNIHLPSASKHCYTLLHAQHLPLLPFCIYLKEHFTRWGWRSNITQHWRSISVVSWLVSSLSKPFVTSPFAVHHL